MSKLIPDYVFDSIYDITPEVLTAHGVRGVLVDLDGTMASHKAALPPDTNRLGLSMREIAVIGDQIFTDVFGGNRAGALTCYVETLDRRFFWINVRYQLERGFIARGRRRMEARAHHG